MHTYLLDEDEAKIVVGSLMLELAEGRQTMRSLQLLNNLKKAFETGDCGDLLKTHANYIVEECTRLESFNEDTDECLKIPINQFELEEAQEYLNSIVEK